jgi:hypothetical protein
MAIDADGSDDVPRIPKRESLPPRSVGGAAGRVSRTGVVSSARRRHDSSSPHYPALWQCSFGALGGAALPGAMRVSLEGFVVSILAELLLGYLPFLWIRHLQVT